MAKTDNVCVQFEVTVSDSKYSYQSKSVKAEARLVAPRNVLGTLDPSNILTCLFQVALVEYDNATTGERENSNNSTQEGDPNSEDQSLPR